jgi:hypothetical protein
MRKMWENVGKCGKMWENVEKCGKMWKNVEKCGKMWENMGKCEKMWKMWKMWENVGKCGKMWENVGKCGKMGKNLEKYGKRWENVGKCGKMYCLFFTKLAILMWRSTVPTLFLQLGFPGVPIMAKIKQKKLFERVHNRFKLKSIRYYQRFFFIVGAKAG